MVLVPDGLARAGSEGNRGAEVSRSPDDPFTEVHIFEGPRAGRWTVEGEQPDLRRALAILLEAGRRPRWDCYMLVCGCKHSSPVPGQPISACVFCFGLGRQPYVLFDPIAPGTALRWGELLQAAGVTVVHESRQSGAEEPGPEGAHGRITVDVFRHPDGLRLKCSSHSDLVEQWLAEAGFVAQSCGGGEFVIAAEEQPGDLEGLLLYRGCRVFSHENSNDEEA